MSFIARVRVKRSWVYDYDLVDTYVRCENHAEMVELRRLLKRKNKKITVLRLPDITSARYEIEELEKAELKAHPEVLLAISALRKETPWKTTS